MTTQAAYDLVREHSTPTATRHALLCDIFGADYFTADTPELMSSIIELYNQNTALMTRIKANYAAEWALLTSQDEDFDYPQVNPLNMIALCKAVSKPEDATDDEMYMKALQQWQGDAQAEIDEANEG